LAIDIATVTSVLRAFFEGSSADTVFVGDVPKPDAHLHWVDELFTRSEPHEPDYRIFGKLRDSGSTIIDVGANYGYSATSIWAVGSAACVLSFEPIEAFGPMFDRIAQLRPGRFDYRVMALGTRPGQLDLVMPVLNGVGVTALTTGSPHPHFAAMAHNIATYASAYGGERLTMYRFAAPMGRLDDVLVAGGFRVPTGKIAAIKVDAEGMEGDVLDGARATIKRHLPLVMADHSPRPRAVMEEMGFKMAELSPSGDMLQETAMPRLGVNGWFFHPSRQAEYQAAGILQ
jgi:FkbM family methyltransferase